MCCLTHGHFIEYLLCVVMSMSSPSSKIVGGAAGAGGSERWCKCLGAPSSKLHPSVAHEPSGVAMLVTQACIICPSVTVCRRTVSSETHLHLLGPSLDRTRLSDHPPRLPLAIVDFSVPLRPPRYETFVSQTSGPHVQIVEGGG